VGRYLTAKNIRESRLGLLMNGLVKVPMQFLILIIGSLVFVFYLYYSAPVFFNQKQVDKVMASEYRSDFEMVQAKNDSINVLKLAQTNAMVDALHSGDEATIESSKQELTKLEED